MNQPTEQEIKSQLQQFISEVPILLFMKGSPDHPQCGFSAATVECLAQCKAPYSFVDILEQPSVRKLLPDVSDWPTFPQLFIAGELVGGSDIVRQLSESGELATLIENAKPKDDKQES